VGIALILRLAVTTLAISCYNATPRNWPGYRRTSETLQQSSTTVARRVSNAHQAHAGLTSPRNVHHSGWFSLLANLADIFNRPGQVLESYSELIKSRADLHARFHERFRGNSIRRRESFGRINGTYLKCKDGCVC
jgi:hypothetical protein